MLQRLENHRILVLGDVMLDRYLTGSVTRISPEAPVPIVLHQHTEDRLGGAANVALNIAALGAEPVLCSVIGDDADGEALASLLPRHGIDAGGLVASAQRRTTVKTRVIGNHQQMLRLDREDTHDLTDDEAADLLLRVRQLLDERPVAAIIFQDYNKGVLAPEVIRAVLAEARQRGILTTVDPKKANFWAFEGVDLFKPNLKEMRDSAPFPVQPTLESLQQAADYLRTRLGHRHTMITLSERGLFWQGTAGPGAIYPTAARNIADVSGAGDTVISIATLGLAAGLPVPDIAQLANLAGGQVCEFPGVVPVQREILAQEWDRFVVNRAL
jgi:D-glycero-beta-D-manno-heptose-7-phosphate kinase